MDVLFDYWPIVGFASFFVVALLFSLLFRRRTPLPYEMRPALLTPFRITIPGRTS